MSQSRPWWASGVKALITYQQLLADRTHDDHAKMARSLEPLFSADLPQVHWVLFSFNEITEVKGPVQHL